MNFFDGFNNFVPYFVSVIVGKNKSFKTDPSKKNFLNYKGKMVSFYKRSETKEDLEEYGFGVHKIYLPAEEVSMPIEITVTSKEKIRLKFEETSKYTNRKTTRHRIRIFNTDNAQIGYVSFCLTPAGDIERKTCFYSTPNDSEELEYNLFNSFENGKNVRDEVFTFQSNSNGLTQKVKINQRDGRVIACSIKEQDLETREDVIFQPIIQKGVNEATPKLRKYIVSCVYDETDIIKRGGTLLPRECEDLEMDLKCLLGGFKGDYIGNILRLTDKGYIACIVTKLVKDGKNCRLYTIIDLTGTNITRGDYFESCFFEEERDKKYLERLRNSDKTPTFVTEITENGEEKLISYLGQTVDSCQEYDKFVEDFIAPFKEIRPISISKILNK